MANPYWLRTSGCTLQQAGHGTGAPCAVVPFSILRKGTTNELMIPIHPALARALKAGPVVGMQHLITDARGRPLRGLTGLLETAAERAGLPSHCVAHGLRKAALRRIAEHGGTTKEIAAVSGHRSLSEIEHYTRAADQVRLANGGRRQVTR